MEFSMRLAVTALQPGMVSRVLRALALACALLGAACGDDDEAADGGESGRRAESGRGGGGSERDASVDKPQSGSGGRGSGGSRAADSGGSGGGSAAHSGDGGAGGRQGNAGAGAGGIGGCAAGKREALDAFCSTDQAMCGLTFEQRRESYCGRPSCSSASCAVFEMKSSCGSRVIGTILGGDAFSEYAYYDANGTLVGVQVQRPNPAHPCIIFDAYGETCERIQSKIVDCSAVVDAGL
jgi:hypothetical protein